MIKVSPYGDDLKYVRHRRTQQLSIVNCPLSIIGYPTIISPLGRISFLLAVFLPVRLSISEIGPIRPTYIIKESISFVAWPELSDRPEEKPVVENAETTSKSVSSESVSVFSMYTQKKPATINTSARQSTVKVLYTVCL